jgi:hypothetical protein
MINNSYLPLELHDLNNARLKAANVKYRWGDTFEKFVEDSFEATLADLPNYSADYGLHVDGQTNNEYDVMVYKNGLPKQVQSVFELKDRDLEGIFSIYAKYVKFINQNKGRVYKVKQNGEEVAYPKDIEYFGLINLSRTEGNIYSLVSEYSSMILNQMLKSVGRNLRKLSEATVDDVLREKEGIDRALDEIKYYFVSIGHELEDKKQAKSSKLMRTIRNGTNDISYNNGQVNVGFYLVEELSKRDGVEVVDGKRVIEGIKNNCVLINKQTGELNRDHIEIFILTKILSKDSLGGVITDGMYSHKVKQISLSLMSSILKEDREKIDENLNRLNMELTKESKKISTQKNKLEKTLARLPNEKKAGLKKKVNQMNVVLNNIPTKEDIYADLESRIPNVLMELSKTYDIDVPVLLNKVYGVKNNKNNNRNRNLNELGHYLPPPNLNTMRGGKKIIHIKGVGNRKVRYYKNGNPYVIVGGKKKRLRK